MNTGERQIARAARLVIVLYALSRLLALAREVVIAAVFADSAAYDAYLAAVLVPDIIFNLIAVGALGSAFIPVFASYFAKDDSAGGWKLASSVITLLLIALTAAAGIAYVISRPLVATVLVPGFEPELQDLTTSLMRTMLIAPIIFGISGVIMAILNARQHFFLPALAPSLLNLALIAAVWLLSPTMGIQAMAVGYVIGAILHLVVQLPGLRSVGARLQPSLRLSPGVRQVLRLMAPRVLGLAVVQLNFLVNINLGSRLGEGAVSALNYAWRLMLTPHGILAQAVATAAFPTLAEQAGREEYGQMRQALSSTLRMLFFLTIPAAVGLMVLGRPLVSLLFERGAFVASSTDAVTWALYFYALGLVGHAGVEIAARAFYALHDTWTPVWVGGVAMALNVVLSLLFQGVFAGLGLAPHGGLALANSVATILEMLGLLALLRRRLSGLDGTRLFKAMVRSGLAAAAMAAALILWQRLMSSATPLIIGAGGAVLGATVYLVASLLLRTEELTQMLRLARRGSMD